MAENTFDESGKIINGTLKFRRTNGTLEREEVYNRGHLKTQRSYATDGKTCIKMTKFKWAGIAKKIQEITFRPDKTKETETFFEGFEHHKVGYLPDGKTVDYEFWVKTTSCKGNFRIRRKDGTLEQQITYNGDHYKVEGFLDDGETLDWAYTRKRCSEKFQIESGNERKRRQDGTLATEYNYYINYQKNILSLGGKFSNYTRIETGYYEDGKTRKYQCDYRYSYEKKDYVKDGWHYEFDNKEHVTEARHYTRGKEDTDSCKLKLALLKKVARARVDSAERREVLPKIENKNFADLAWEYVKAKVREKTK